MAKKDGNRKVGNRNIGKINAQSEVLLFFTLNKS